MKNYYRSFLVINPFGIGDVLFSTPLVRNLNTAYPDSEIYYLCNSRANFILKDNPLIHKTFVYDRDDFEAEKENSRMAWFKKYRNFIRSIRKKHIEVSIDLSLNSKFGFFSWAAGIKKRLGLDYKNRGRFLTDKVFLKGFDDRHVAEYYLDVLNLLGLMPQKSGLEVYLNDADKEWVLHYLAKNIISEQDIVIGIAPCGGQAFGEKAWMKRWDIDKFSELSVKLSKKFNAKVFIFAGASEKKEVSQMINKLGNGIDCYEFTDFSLDKIVALVDRCSLFIGNDTGPLRFAEALNKPIVGIFGPVDEKVYGAFPESRSKIIITKDIACRPCYKNFKLPQCPYDRKCLKDITVEEVFQAAKSLLETVVKDNSLKREENL